MPLVSYHQHFALDKTAYAHNLVNDVQIQNFVFQLMGLEAPFKPACGTKHLLTSQTYSASRCRAECNFKYQMELCKCRFITLPYGGQKNIYLIEYNLILLLCVPFLYQGQKVYLIEENLSKTLSCVLVIIHFVVSLA